jgi:FkbM family methyltransferase
MLEPGYDSIFEKYKIDDVVYTIPNYHNNEEAKFRIYKKDLVISPIIKQGEIWEPPVFSALEKYIKPHHVVLEAGSFIGLHAVKISKICKKLICLEPVISSTNLLLHNLQLNECSNVEVYPCAISDEVGFSKFQFISNGNPGSTVLENNTEQYSDTRPWDPLPEDNYNVPIFTIDFLNLETVDVIKLDVEGYEIKALMGAIDTIRKNKPILIVEWWKEMEKTFQFIFDLGYKYERLNGYNYVFLPG